MADVSSIHSQVGKSRMPQVRGAWVKSSTDLAISSENAICEAPAHDKVTLSVSLPNDTLLLISCVCTRPASARPASQ